MLRLVPAQVHVAEEEGGESIATHLSALLGQPVRLGIHLGPPRANQKPVLQVLTPEGRTLGFAKIGANVLTRQLVAAEAQALEAVAAAGVAGLGVPRSVTTAAGATSRCCSSVRSRAGRPPP